MRSRSLKLFEVLVRQALEMLPDEIRAHLHNIVVDIEDDPPRDVLVSLGFTEAEIAAGETVFGLYEDIAPIDEGPALAQQTPHRIVIYRRPLEEAFPDPRQLVIEVHKTVIHELAHRLGLSDDDLARFDDDANPFAPDDKGGSGRRLPKRPIRRPVPRRR